ncbi:MAG: hypothetical protein Q8L98_01160 [Chlamydiales bacterium]|nr:hypothetical protein [Chlamydiales bacterium]
MSHSMTVTSSPSYIDKIPQGILPQVAKGALVTVAISLVLGSPLPIVALGATLAATITVVEAVSRPFFEAVLPNISYVKPFIQIFIPVTIVLSLAFSAAPWFTLNPFIARLPATFLLNVNWGNDKKIPAIAWVC